MSLHQYIQNVCDEVEREMPQMAEENDNSRRLTEIAEGWAGQPIGNKVLAEMLLEDLTLGMPDETEMFSQCSDVFAVIRNCLAQRLQEEANSHMQGLKDEYENDKADAQSDGWEVTRMPLTREFYLQQDITGEGEDYHELHDKLFKTEYEAWRWLQDNGADLDFRSK